MFKQAFKRRHHALPSAVGILVALSLTTSCNNPQSPSPTPGTGDFQGHYGSDGSIEFQFDAPDGRTTPLRLVASDLVFDPTAQELHVQVSIRNSGGESVPTPEDVLVGGFDPITVAPVNATPIPCPACIGCDCPWPWSYDTRGTGGEDGVLSPGETSTPVEWILSDPNAVSFAFRARLQGTTGAPSGTIAGFVFADANRDGRRDPGETGIAGALVSLLRGDLGEATTTGPDGRFEFQVTEEGLYEVSRQPAADCRATTPLQHRVIIVRRPDGSLSGYDHADFGCGGPGPVDSLNVAVFGIVFEDMNRNGQLDRGEPGVPNVLVVGSTPQCPTFAPIMIHTDENGRYRMQLPSCLPPYIVHRAPIPGFIDTTPNPLVFGGAVRDSFPPPPPPHPHPMPSILQANFGVARADSDSTRPAAVEGFVFRDVNRNGTHDPGEIGIAGVGVTANGLICANPGAGFTQTDARGHYRIEAVEVHCPLPWLVFHGPIERACDTSPNPIQLDGPPPPDRILHADFGVAACDSVPPPLDVRVEGVVWNDANLNGTRERGEAGILGATVRLITPLDIIIETQTDAEGHYAFQSHSVVFAVEQVAPFFPIHTTPNPHPIDPATTLPGDVVRVDFGVNRATP